MNRTLIIMSAVALLLVGCATTPEVPPGKPTVTAAPRTLSPKTTVSEARRLTQAADRHNDVARSELDATSNLIADFRDGDFRQLQNLVTRLRDQASATGEELQELYDRVFSADTRIQSLLVRVQKVKDALQAEKELRHEADEKLVKAQGEIASKDQEVDQLRQQFNDMKVTADSFEANSQKNHKAALDAKGAADKAKGKNELLVKALFSVGALLMLSLIGNYLQLKGIF